MTPGTFLVALFMMVRCLAVMMRCSLVTRGCFMMSQAA